VSRASELPFCYYEKGYSRCVSRLDAGWLVAHPVVRGPRRIALAYGSEGNRSYNVHTERQELVKMRTAPFVRCSGTDDQGVVQLANAMEWTHLSAPILRVPGGFTSFVVDVSSNWCIVTLWVDRKFMSWAFPVPPTLMGSLRERLTAQKRCYRSHQRGAVLVEVFDGGFSPPDVSGTLTVLETGP
jgi:hypothetical protein